MKPIQPVILRIFFSLFFLICCVPKPVVYAQDEDVVIEEIAPISPVKETLTENAESIIRDAENLIEEAEKALRYSKNPAAKNNGTVFGLKKVAFLKGLNKITAATSLLSVGKGMTTDFGNLEIKMYECWKSPPTERAEVKALLEIWERKLSEAGTDFMYDGENIVKKKLFSGWMFASSPALSSLEHPIYDITVQDCQS